MATTNGSLDPIYQRLNSVDRYHPFSSDTFHDWSMEAGDTINVSRDGSTIQSPVHTTTLTWKGQPKVTVSSEGSETRPSVTRQTKNKYGRGGSGLRNDMGMWRYMSDIYGALTSSLELTESMLRLEFQGRYDGLQSELEFTRSALRIEFRGLYDGLSSHFELTRSQLQVTFQGMYDGLSSEFLLTRSELRTEFRGLYDGLNSEFQITRSELRAEFEGLYDGLSSDFQLTRSQLRVEFEGLYDGLSSDFRLTRSELRTEFKGLYDGLSSDLTFTRSALQTEFRGLYDGLSSDFKLTRSELRTEFRGLYDGLSSDFRLTRSEMKVEFKGMYDGLSSSFELTRSRMAVALSDTYSELSSRIEQTASSFGVVIEGTGSNAHIKPAVIQASIDAASSTSKILLSADHIELDGEAVANALDVEDDITCGTIECAGLTVSGETYFDVDSPLLPYGASSGDYNWGDVIVSAEVDASTNTLTLTRLDGTTVDFRKAVSLSGEWDGGNFPLTIKSDNSNKKTIGFTNANDYHLSVEKNGAVSLVGNTGKFVNVPYKIVEHIPASGVVPASEQTRYQGSLALVDVTDAYNAGVSSVTIDKIIGVKFGSREYTRKAIGITATASNNYSLGASLTLSDPTTYTGSDSKSHRCIELNGKYEENGSIVSGVIGRVDIDSVYTAGYGAGESAGISAGVSSVTISSIGLASNYSALSNTDVRSNIYIEAIASNGNSKSDKLLVLGKTTYDSGKRCVNLYDGNSVIGRININSTYDDGWQAARSSVNSKTYTVSNKTYSYFPTTTPDTLISHIRVATPSSTVDGSLNSVSYYVTSGKNDAYIRYSTSAGKTVAKYTHGQYNAGWTAAQGSVSDKTYSVNSKTYNYFPTTAPSTKLNYMKVAMPNSVIDGAKSDYTYHVTGGSGKAYIHYGNASGPIVAEGTHSYTRTEAEYSGQFNTGWNTAILPQSSGGALRVDASAMGKTLGYGEPVTVRFLRKDTGGTETELFAQTYWGPADRFNTGWDAALTQRQFGGALRVDVTSMGKVLDYDEDLVFQVWGYPSDGSAPFEIFAQAYKAPPNTSADYDTGFDADHQMFITGPGSDDKISEVSRTPGTEINYYPTFKKKGSGYQYGSPIKVKVPSVTHQAPTANSMTDNSEKTSVSVYADGATTNFTLVKTTVAYGGVQDLPCVELRIGSRVVGRKFL